MIESIWTRNLLCFDENEHLVDCAPLTVLVGPNNSGKSALITGFNLLREAGMRGGPYWETESYNLGDFSSAVHKHETNRIIEVGTRIRDTESPITLTTSFEGGAYQGFRSSPSVPNPMNLLRKIDPELSILKSPLRRNLASLETTSKYSDVSVNLAYQGTGIQKALTIIA